MKTFGEKIGIPFLFGDYGNELKTLKIQISNKGLNMISPFFVESSITNICIDNLPVNLNLYDKFNDYLIFEENIFTNSQKISDDIIKYNLIKDFNSENIDLSIRQNSERKNKNERNLKRGKTRSLNVENRKNTFIENINKENLISEAEELYNNKIKKKKFRK
jgi:uncharacterized ubiquitin-like protein YukD